MDYFYQRQISSHRLPLAVFKNLDNVERLARHMSQRSAAMLGSRLDLTIDKTQAGVGAHYGWRGRILGLPIEVDEEVTVYDPPNEKRWCTVGKPQLVVLSRYCMGFTLREGSPGTIGTLRLDYDLPRRGWNAVAGRLLGHSYARWCVDRMAADVET